MLGCWGAEVLYVCRVISVVAANTTRLFQALRQRKETAGKLPAYPADVKLHAHELVVDVLQQSGKICKSKAASSWRTKCRQTVLHAREKAEDGVAKAIAACEKLGVKASKSLIKSRAKAAEKWTKDEKKRLDARVKPFQKASSDVEYATDVNKDNVK